MNKTLKIVLISISVAFLVGYTIGKISVINSNSEITKEKKAYELIQEGFNRIENE